MPGTVAPATIAQRFAANEAEEVEELLDHRDADRRSRLGQALGDLLWGEIGPADILLHRVAGGMVVEDLPEVGVQLRECFEPSFPPPFLADPLAQVVRQLSQVFLALAVGLGVAAQEGGDDLGAAVAKFNRLDGGVASAVLFRQRAVEQPHRVFDLGAKSYERRSVTGSWSRRLR